jgi:hypothetical protein
MEHILTQCEAPGQATIWNEAKKLWERKGKERFAPGIGTIIECGAASFTSSKNKPIPGISRFFTILISESADLIWNLRCERVIANDNRAHSELEIKQR